MSDGMRDLYDTDLAARLFSEMKKEPSSGLGQTDTDILNKCIVFVYT
jgi:hypothetical protein